MKNLKKNSSTSLENIPEEHREEAIEWLKNLEVRFEDMSKATGWPIEKIRKIYNMFGIHLGIALENGEDGREIE
jgi:hypothetical protein